MVWYYLLSLQLLVLMQVAYFSLYSLSKYQLITRTDSINTTLSLFLSLFILFFIVSLWYLTAISRFEGTADDLNSKAATRHTQEKEPTNKTDEQEYYNRVVNLSEIKESTRND